MPDYKTTSKAPGFDEIGMSGLKRWGGTVSEEFLPELTGERGARVYKEMSDNDPIIGAILFAIKMLIRQASWRVDPAPTKKKEDEEAAEFVESCLDDMSQTWQDTLSEILTFLPFGWSYHEIVYKRRGGNVNDPTKRSKYDDGLIGWRKLPLRAQETLFQWDFDEEDGGIRAMTQSPPPDYRLRTVPIEKALLFRTEATKNNPEGRSILRNAYRPWYFKRRIEEIEGIGIERDLAGLPVLTPPDGLDLWNENDPQMVQLLRMAESLVQNVRRDQMEGIVKPFGWEFVLMSTNGKRSIDTSAVINRYEQRIAMTVLADFILLGHEKVGSFALSSDKTSLFSVAIGAWLDTIAEIFNRYAIPRLFELNPSFHLEELPKLSHGDIEAPDLKDLSAFIKELTGVGVIIPDAGLEDYLREVAHLPERPEDGDFYPTEPKQPKNGKEDDEDELEQDDPEKEAAAKRRLGREE